jgi:hypothetical protein
MAAKALPFHIEFRPLRIRKNNRSFDLPFRYLPITSEKAVFLARADNSKTMSFVKTDCPYGIRPSTDQHRSWRQMPQMRQQVRSNSSLLAASGDVSVPYQSDVLDCLNAHHANQLFVFLISPEYDAVIDFMAQLARGHVWFRPAIFGDDAFIGLCAIVDDGRNQREVVVITAADHEITISSEREKLSYYQLLCTFFRFAGTENSFWTSLRSQEAERFR